MIIYGSRNSVYFSDVSHEKDTESKDDKGNLVVNQLWLHLKCRTHNLI